MKIKLSKFLKSTRLLKSGLLIVVFAFGTSGCYKNSIEDCLRLASKAPTAEGVGVAISACEEKFKKPISDVERIVKNSEKCDIPKLEEYATWIVTNESQKGSSEFEKVAVAYKKLRATCDALKKIKP